MEKDLNCLPVLGMGVVCFCFETMHIFFIVLPGYTFLSSEWESRNSLIEWGFENRSGDSQVNRICAIDSAIEKSANGHS